MPATLGSAVRLRVPLPDLIECGQVNVLRAPLEDAAGAVAPSSGTVTISRPGGEVLVDAASVTIVSSVAQYSWTPSASIMRGDVLVEWELVTASYGTIKVRNDGVICRVRLTCPIAAADLWPLARGLNPDGNDPISALTVAEIEQDIGEAWILVQQRLLSSGRRQHLVISAYALREVCQRQALAITYDSLSHRLNEAYGAIARDQRDLLEDAWGRVRLVYDEADDGTPDAGRKSGRKSALWIGS